MKRPPRATPIALNLAPMVDVMMCLLIFFMLATRLVEQEHSRIDLPEARAAREMERKNLGNRFVVNIRPTAGPDAAVQYLLREQPVALDQVLAQLRVEHMADADVNCVIRADRGVAYRHVEAILSGCAEFGVKNLTLAALQSEGAR